MEQRDLQRIGPFVVDLKQHELRRGERRIPLQPQPMKVLEVLATNAGRLLTRKELQNAVWDGGTFIDFDQGLNWCIKRIREVLGDDAANPRYIETIPRRGYRLIASEAPRRSRWLSMAAALAIACFAAAGGYRQPPFTVVILPFDNFTGDPRNDVVASAVTEDVINRVGSVDPQRLKVIDRLTAAKFKRTNECIIHIGRELGAQFVVEGSLQNRHATAALYRVADNTQVWATAVRVDSPSEVIAAKIATTFVR